jgi:hypothetical protein
MLCNVVEIRAAAFMPWCLTPTHVFVCVCSKLSIDVLQLQCARTTNINVHRLFRLMSFFAMKSATTISVDEEHSLVTGTHHCGRLDCRFPVVVT